MDGWMYVCLSTCIYIYIHIHVIDLHVYVCMYIYVYIFTYAHTYVSMLTHYTTHPTLALNLHNTTRGNPL